MTNYFNKYKSQHTPPTPIAPNASQQLAAQQEIGPGEQGFTREAQALVKEFNVKVVKYNGLKPNLQKGRLGQLMQKNIDLLKESLEEMGCNVTSSDTGVYHISPNRRMVEVTQTDDMLELRVLNPG